MFAVVIVCIMALVFIGGVGYAIFGRDSKWIGAVVAAGAALLGLVTWLAASYTTVGPSDVAIVTSFGHTDGDIGPGIHWLWPWQNAATWDGSVQTISYGRDTDQHKPDHCLLVRIGGQQSACVALTFTYKLRDGSADNLFVNYRTQTHMADVLVQRSLDQALNRVLETYSPIQAMASGNVNGAALSPYAAKVLALMQHDIGQDILVGTACKSAHNATACSLLLPYVVYDPSTTNRLNQYQTQLADTLIAKQLEQTNLALAQANANLAAHSNLSQGVLVQNCLSIVTAAMKAGYPLPPTFNCFGSGGGVLVNTGK